MPGSSPPGSSTSATKNQNPVVGAPHTLFVQWTAEAIGFCLLAIVADFNDDLGGVIVAIMIGWFIIFAMNNNGEIQKLFSKVGG